MGDDFQYTDAAVNFHSMDKLIKLVYNSNSNNIILFLNVYIKNENKKKIMITKK